MHGKAITVLEMDHPIVDFLTLCETPYPNGEFIKQNRIIESINELNFSNIRIPVRELHSYSRLHLKNPLLLKVTETCFGF